MCSYACEIRIFIALLIEFYCTRRRQQFCWLLLFFLLRDSLYDFRAYLYFILYAGHRMRLMIVPCVLEFVFLRCVLLFNVSPRDNARCDACTYKCKKDKSGYRTSPLFYTQSTWKILYIASKCTKLFFSGDTSIIYLLYPLPPYLCLSYINFMYKLG